MYGGYYSPKPAALSLLLSRDFFVRKSRSFGVSPSNSQGRRAAGGIFGSDERSIDMNTYIINVERKTIKEYTVQAESLDKAEKEAMKLYYADSVPGKTTVQAFCTCFLPFSKKV